MGHTKSTAIQTAKRKKVRIDLNSPKLQQGINPVTMKSNEDMKKKLGIGHSSRKEECNCNLNNMIYFYMGCRQDIG